MMPKPLRIIFMGTPPFAVTILEALLQANHDIVAVFTQPDKPSGRGRKTVFPPVKTYALDKGLPLYQPTELAAEEWPDLLQRFEADVAVVAAYGRILPEPLLHTTKAGFVNVHASLLPAYRGAAPIQWALRNGDATTGITLMQMDAHMDTGDILVQESLAIDVNETSGSLFARLATLGADMLVRHLPDIVSGRIIGEPQNGALATYAPAFPRDDERINWQHSATAIHALIRAYLPETGCYSIIDGNRLKLFTTEVQAGEQKAEPGTVVAVHKDHFSVQTGDGFLLIYDVQPPGKKKMSSRDFLNGYSLKIGARFDS